MRPVRLIDDDAPPIGGAIIEGRPMPIDPIPVKLATAIEAVQRLEKDLRNLRNRAEATDAEVELAKHALEDLRRIASGRGIRPVNIDSRGHRAAVRRSSARRASEGND